MPERIILTRFNGVLCFVGIRTPKKREKSFNAILQIISFKYLSIFAPDLLRFAARFCSM